MIVVNLLTTVLIGGFVFAKPRYRQKKQGENTHMKKVLFLSSALIMTTLGAFADDVAPNTDKKITGGAGTCTVDVLGVSDNNATANTIATWSLNSYECAAGQYLDETTLNCIECPTGSYCPGGTFTVEANNSKTACPADYTSDAAATAETECYMGCELACTQQTCPEHSENCTHGVSSTTGRQYVDATCNAEKTFCSIDFECAPGYNKIIANYEYIMTDLYNTFIPSIPASCGLNGQPDSYRSEITNILQKNDCDIINQGEIFVMGDRVITKWQVSYNNHSIDNSDVIRKIYTDTNGNNQIFAYTYDANFTTEITGSNIWVKPINVFVRTPVWDYVWQILSQGIAYSESDLLWKQLRSSVSATDFELIKSFLNKADDDPSVVSIEEYWTTFVTATSVELTMNIPWIYIGDNITDLPTDAEEGFAETNQFAMEVLQEKFMTNADYENNPFLRFLSNNGATYCMNNSININWNPDNGTDASQSMCMYNNGLATPDDPVRPGYTFTGWKLVK